MNRPKNDARKEGLVTHFVRRVRVGGVVTWNCEVLCAASEGAKSSKRSFLRTLKT